MDDAVSAIIAVIAGNADSADSGERREQKNVAWIRSILAVPATAPRRGVRGAAAPGFTDDVAGHLAISPFRLFSSRR